MGNKTKAVGKQSSSHKKSDNNTSTSRRANATTGAAAAAAVTSWPPFKPELPVAELVFDTPIPTLRDQIVLLRNFWPKSLCRDYLAFLSSLPLTTTPGRPKRGEATRVNDRFQTQDAQLAQRFWLQTGLRDAVLHDAVKHLWGGEVVGLNPNLLFLVPIGTKVARSWPAKSGLSEQTFASAGKRDDEAVFTRIVNDLVTALWRKVRQFAVTKSQLPGFSSSARLHLVTRIGR
ncbi:hypothetical protein GQX73_g5047 [Xylaria multiplex]|uniref:Uncharacterized protein n=1 Tax=Xylaria multiplex TaxID=323545 RepID=A0A7C8J1D1_9PEZI|nr:hypothetical protein GQX73_g5047 [Xylaria multiplex]